MIPEPQQTYVLELLAALGPAADDLVLADAQAMKFAVEGATENSRVSASSSKSAEKLQSAMPNSMARFGVWSATPCFVGNVMQDRPGRKGTLERSLSNR
jgi:hypothetical protein